MIDIETGKQNDLKKIFGGKRMVISCSSDSHFNLSSYYGGCNIVGTYDKSLWVINAAERKGVLKIENLNSGVSCVRTSEEDSNLIFCGLRGESGEMLVYVNSFSGID